MKTNITSKALYIRGQLELEKHMFYYNCKTQEELEELLAEDYGTTLIVEGK